MSMLERATPFVVIVAEVVAPKVMFPVSASVIDAESVRFPVGANVFALPAKVPVKPVKSMLWQAPPPAAHVTMPPECVSKNTSSELVGTVAPPAPPDVVDHFDAAVESHDAVPPTQNRIATSITAF
jgi:hypothetical protein